LVFHSSTIWYTSLLSLNSTASDSRNYTTVCHYLAHVTPLKHAQFINTGQLFSRISSILQNVTQVKCTLVRALRLCTGRTAYTGSKRITLLFLDHGTRRGEGSASRPGRSLPPGKTRYPLHRRLGGPHGGSGQVRKISPLPGLDPPDRPARSQSL
jgi:hypothetical protein